MGLSTFTSHLAALVALHAALAAPSAPSASISSPERLIADNQTVYRLAEGEVRSLELNTSSLFRRSVHIAVSPCSRDLHWTLYHGPAGRDGHLSMMREHSGGDISVFSVPVVLHTRYVLQLRSTGGGAAAVAARAEPTRLVRLRLRARSRSRLAANWDPSPIDPQATAYCVVASHRRNYTSLCAAQFDAKSNRIENRPRFDTLSTEGSREVVDNASKYRSESTEVDNQIVTDSFSMYEGNFRNVYRRRKFGRSTKASDGDPVVACVGDRTHHVIENLDPTMTYTVNVFGVGRDRRAGALLASGAVRARANTARRLRGGVAHRADVRGRTVYYYKAAPGAGGLWVSLTACGGAIDAEVLVRGKRLYLAKNIEPHTKFFVRAPVASSSSMQETSEEGSIQFDSSSEEARTRYVVRVNPSRPGAVVGLELTVSTTQWGPPAPELQAGDGAAVRELRPRRACRSVDVAFLPARHDHADVIRYCVTAREYVNGDSYPCAARKAARVCIDHIQRPPQRVIIQKVTSLKPATKYSIQVTASNKNNTVPYNVLYVDTTSSCKDGE